MDILSRYIMSRTPILVEDLDTTNTFVICPTGLNEFIILVDKVGYLAHANPNRAMTFISKEQAENFLNITYKNKLGIKKFMEENSSYAFIPVPLRKE